LEIGRSDKRNSHLDKGKATQSGSELDDPARGFPISVRCNCQIYFRSTPMFEACKLLPQELGPVFFLCRPFLSSPFAKERTVKMLGMEGEGTGLKSLGRDGKDDEGVVGGRIRTGKA